MGLTLRPACIHKSAKMSMAVIMTAKAEPCSDLLQSHAVIYNLHSVANTILQYGPATSALSLALHWLVIH